MNEVFIYFSSFILLTVGILIAFSYILARGVLYFLTRDEDDDE